MQKKTDYATAVATKYPEQVVIVVAKDARGRANPITIGWTMIASGSPPMMAIAVANGHYSVEAIRSSGCFTIAYPSAEMADAALFFGSRSGREVDKFAEFRCATKNAEAIDSILLDDAAANFECVLKSETQAGDHVIFVGQVVCSHVNGEARKRLYVVGPGHKMGPVKV